MSCSGVMPHMATLCLMLVHAEASSRQLLTTRSAERGAIEIRSAWFAEEVVLQPPLYGFEQLFSPNASEFKGFPTRLTSSQRVAHVEGSAGNVRHAELSLRQTLYIHGARWRSQVHPLCLAMDHVQGPTYEVRECDRAASGPFHAAVWVPLLATKPVTPPPPGPSREQWNRLPSHPSALRRYLNLPCEWLQPLLLQHAGDFGHRHQHAWRGGFADHVRWHCGRQIETRPKQQLAGGAGPVTLGTLLLNETVRKAMGIFQVNLGNLVLVMMGLAMALRDLPHPFTIVESGNLCGGVTMMLGLLKRAVCPQCPFISADPGWYRLVSGHSLSCAADTLRYGGVRNDVTLVECALRRRGCAHMCTDSQRESERVRERLA